MLPSAHVSATDADLLRAYAQHRSEPAFADLVHRHLDFVYASAKRQLGSSALAEDVAQSVFLDLARSAASLRPDPSLVAWLHVVTRRTAVDLIRRESRRRTREQTAAALSAMDSPPPSSWSQLAPHLDDALARLNATDRTAVLLRFFENKSLREIGAALHLTDDAAQKRLARALEKLRATFARRGLAVTAATLATDLSAHALETAPAHLGATISSLATAPAAGAVALSQSAATLAMTATQKITVSVVLAAALSTTLYEACIISRQQTDLTALRQRTAELSRELTALHRDRTAEAAQLGDALRQLAAERAKTAKFAAADPAVEAALDDWLQNVIRLKQALEKTPSSQIPELRYLTAKDWLDATKQNPLATDLDVRRALNELRTIAKQHFTEQMMPALKRYLAANRNQPPTDPTQLAPFFEKPVDPDILSRYGTFSGSDLGPDGIRFTSPDGKPATWIIREKQSVDPYYDHTFQLSAEGYGYSGRSDYDREIDTAVQFFRAANNNTAPTAPAQLTPYLHSAIDPIFIQRHLDPRN